MADDLEVVLQQIIPGEKAVFIVTIGINRPETPELTYLQKCWERVWKNAGCMKAPAFLIIPKDMKIEALSDAELKNHGLVRISKP